MSSLQWQWYDRNKKAAPQNMDFTKVQRVNYAFFQTDTQGNMWGTDAVSNLVSLFFKPLMCFVSNTNV